MLVLPHQKEGQVWLGKHLTEGVLTLDHAWGQLTSVMALFCAWAQFKGIGHGQMCGVPFKNLNGEDTALSTH